jgi:nucleoside-diphosphate-sugar epimerase
MNVAIAGAGGYIGSAVGAALLEAGHAVSGIVRPGSEGKLGAGIRAVHGDVADPASLVRAAADADAVVYAVQYNGADAFAVESAALRALADALADRGRTLVYTSGIWLYGNTYPIAAGEDAPHRPPALVAQRAQLEEHIYRNEDGLRGIVIRPGCVYGAGGGLPAMWVQSARGEGAARMVGDGSNHWVMVHRDDLAQLYVLALEKAPAGSIYNGSDETQLTVREMAEAASRGQGKGGAVLAWPLDDARAALGPFADALALDQAVTSMKARGELGWKVRGTTAVDDLQEGSYASA